MAQKRIDEFDSTSSVAPADLMMVGDPATGKLRKITAGNVVTSLKATDAQALTATSTSTLMTPASAAVRDEKYDARRSGALGDGATVNTTALNAALTVVNATATGGTILLPPGSYVTDALTWNPTKPLVLDGPGTLKLVTSASPAALMMFSGSQPVTVRGITFDGNNQTFSAGGDRSVLYSYQRTVNRTRFENIEVKNSLRNGIGTYQGGVEVTNSYIHDCDWNGINLSGDHPTRVTGNRIEACEANGVSCTVAGTAGTFYDATVVVSGNIIRNIANTHGGTGEYGNGIVMYRASGVVVADNHIFNVVMSHIRLNGCSASTISGNVCRTQDVSVVADANLSPGIFVEFGSKFVAVSGNALDNLSASGIIVTNTNQGTLACSVTGNTVSNFGQESRATQPGTGIGVAHGVLSGNTIDGANNPRAVYGINNRGAGTSETTDAVYTGNQIAGTKYAIGLALSLTGGSARVSMSNNVVSRQDANWSSYFGAQGGSGADAGDGSFIGSAIAAGYYLDGGYPGVTAAQRPPRFRVGSRLVVDGVIQTSDGSAWV